MRELLHKIPHPDGKIDSWQGHAVPPAYVPLAARAGDIWFVDGGNAEVLGAPHFSLQKLRAVAVHYPKKEVKQLEGFCLITKASGGWQLEGDAVGTSQGEIADAITVARQQLEHNLAQSLSGLVVLDGDVAPKNCIALQKSITVLTKNNFPLSSVLTAQGPWYAKLGEVFAVKLDSLSRHVFLVHNAIPQQLAILCHYSSDHLFPGYPAGLILADRLARVSKEEAASLRIRAKAMQKDLTRLREAEASVDSHSILDNLR